MSNVFTSAERVNHRKHFETKFARIGADIYKIVGKLFTLPHKFSELCWMWVCLNKQLVCTLYPNFFPVNMIFSAVQPLGYNKICMGFNPRGGARGPLSAPRLLLLVVTLQYVENIFFSIFYKKVVFSRSYCLYTWSAIGIILSSVCLSVALSVSLWRCALWLSGLVYRAKSRTRVFLAGRFLFVPVLGTIKY